MRLLRTAWGRLVAGLTALLTLAWLNNAQFTGVVDWEPTIAFVVAGLAWFLSCFPDSVGERAHDKQLFQRFLDTLTEVERAFLKNHDFGGIFQVKQIDGLRAFSATWAGAAYEFDDPSIQKRFAPILTMAKSLSSAIALKTQMIGADSAGVPWDHANEARSREIAEGLNNQATALVQAIDEFIRQTRRRLS